MQHKTIIAAAILTASLISARGMPLDSLYSRWQDITGHERVRAGEELLDMGRQAGLTEWDPRDSRTGKASTDAAIYDMMAYKYLSEDKFDEALEAGLKALPLCEDADDADLLGNCLNTLGVIYQRKSLFGMAISYMERVYQIDLKHNDNAAMSSTLNNLASLYLATGESETALSCILPAVEMERKSRNSERLAIRLGMASEVWLSLGNSEEALECIDKAYKLDHEDGRETKAAIRLSQKAAILASTGDTDEAKDILESVIPVLEGAGKYNSLAICHNQLGRIYADSKRPVQAAEEFRLAARNADESGNDFIKRKALDGLWRSYKETGLYATALDVLEEYCRLSDEFSKDRAECAVEDFKTRYDTLQKDNEIVRQRSRAQLRMLIIFAVSAFALFLLVLLVLSRRMLAIKRHEALVLAKNHEVKSRLLSLVSSITDKGESDAIKGIVSVVESMGDVPKMTRRELDVIRLCCDGLSSKEIADRLNVSVRTVDAHKANIFKKLGISSTVELVRYAARAGLFGTGQTTGDEPAGSIRPGRQDAGTKQIAAGYRHGPAASNQIINNL